MNNDIVQHITLELSREVSKRTISVKRYDTNIRRIGCTIINNGAVIDLNDVASAVVKGTKPDGTVFYDDCTVVGNEISFTCTTQMLAVMGDIVCELQIAFIDSSVITSPTFYIHVYESQNVGEESQNEYGAIVAIHANVQLLQSQALAAKNRAVEAEENAEDYAAAAQGSANDAETAKQDAQASATACASYEASSQSNAESAEQSALSSAQNAGAAAISASSASNSASSAETSATNASSSATLAGEAQASCSASKSACENARETCIDKAESAAESAAQAYEYLQEMGQGQLVLGETDTTAYRGDRGKAAYDHSQITSGNPHNVTAAEVGADASGSAAQALDDAKGYTDTEIADAVADLKLITGDLEELETLANSDLVSAVNEVNSAALGASRCICYASYSAMVTALNDESLVLLVGQNIYVQTMEVPDLWVYANAQPYTEYEYIDDATIISTIEEDGYIDIGTFRLAMLETAKVDLTEINADIASLKTRVTAAETAITNLQAMIGYPIS